MNWIDIACFACLLILSVIGLWRGLVSSIFRLCAWVTALLGAYFAQDVFGDFAMRNFAFGEFAAHLICSCVGFLLPFLLFSFIGHLVGETISSTVVGKANRICGFLFGLLKASLICYVLLTIMHLLPVEGNLKNLRNESIAYNFYKSSLEIMGVSSDEVNLRKMAKNKASELTRTITDKAVDKAKETVEDTADSTKDAAKEAVTRAADEVSKTAENAKQAIINTIDKGVSGSSKDTTTKLSSSK